MISKENDKTKELLKFYFEKKISVHIKFKESGWINGLILKIEYDKIILDENKYGEMLIFIDKILEVNPMKERGE